MNQNSAFSTRLILYEWGSRTWNGGRGYSLPKELWTLEEISGAVLSALECRHDLRLPAPLGAKSAPKR